LWARTQIGNWEKSVKQVNQLYETGIPHHWMGRNSTGLNSEFLHGAKSRDPLWQNVATVSGQMYELSFASKAPQLGTSEFVGYEVGGSDPYAIGPWVVNVDIDGAQIGSYENDSMTTWEYFTTNSPAIHRGDRSEDINSNPRQGRKRMPPHRLFRPSGTRPRDPRETPPMNRCAITYRRSGALETRAIRMHLRMNRKWTGQAGSPPSP
jgi:hypothetical protein